MIHTLARTALAITLLGTLASAEAALIDVRYDGFANGSRNGTLFGPEQNTSRSVAAGQFEFDVISDPNNAYWDDTLQAFCVDATEWLVTGSTVTYDLLSADSAGLLDAAQLGRVAWLYDNYADQLGSRNNDVAFQLALWELIYDGSPLSIVGSDTANRGTFWAAGFGSAHSLAESWLVDLSIAGPDASYVSDTYEFFLMVPYNPLSNQALVLARPMLVSEPSMLAIVGFGLLALGVARRRQRR